MSEITRDDVQAGDRVFFGSLGHFHEGVAYTIEDGDPVYPDKLYVRGAGMWYSSFISAERPAAPLMFDPEQSVSRTPRTSP